jgi:glycosyltransferase involved in cell wall biosynthesis
MKPLLLNTFENIGGAAIATNRLHKGLRSIGVDSRLLVQARQTDDFSVIAPTGRLQQEFVRYRPRLDTLPARFYDKQMHALFSAAWQPERLAGEILKIAPDIVHLFWINAGFMRIETLQKLQSPIIWTLHDMWPFTGGCHYDEACGKFRQDCGACPVLHSRCERDLSRRILLRKREAWKETPITVVATSRWLADMARSSSLFNDRRIEIIPNGLDTEKFKPLNKRDARYALNLPQDKKLILFSAFRATSDKRKGSQHLMPALERMAADGWAEKAELLMIGASSPQDPPDLGMKVHYMGYLQDEISQVLLYSAADATIAPSVQENLSNTVMESLACGTPAIAFDIGGMPDMIDHRANGYLARPFDSADLAEGIKWVLGNEERHASLSSQSRRSVLERFALDRVAGRYLALYSSVLRDGK